MSLDKMQQMIAIIDDNKENISESDYLKLCNLMKDIYNCQDTSDNTEDDSYEMSYNHSEKLKCIINIFVISTNISNIILMYLFMNKMNTE